MSQPQPPCYYTVQSGDTLSSIAAQAYGDPNLWEYIYQSNGQVIGANPDHISPGMVLYLLANPPQTRTFSTPQLCTVTAASLNIRVAPTTKSNVVANYPQGTTLNFAAIVVGEPFDGNSSWGVSQQGHFYWMGGTSQP